MHKRTLHSFASQQIRTPLSCQHREHHATTTRRTASLRRRSTSLQKMDRCRWMTAATFREVADDPKTLQHPWKEWVTFEAGYKEGACPPQVARRIIGMGTWLTRGMLEPPFEFLVSEIEGLWRQILDNSGFGLRPFDPKFKWIDSMDKDGTKGEMYTRESENPSPTDPEYPRMFVENRMYGSDKFSKLHLGVGIRQDGVQFVHCAMVPKPEYDMPIFAVDMIGMKCISLAHVDLYPVSQDHTLPEIYLQGMRLLQTESIESNRSIPRWTKEIASPMMISVSPSGDSDAVRFLSYASLLCKVYMKTAEIAEPLSSPERITEIKGAHERFAIDSKENEQFRTALGKSFGDDWTHDYLTNCFFPLE